MATTDRSLSSLLGEVHAGSIQVPEFQRDLVLRDSWVRSLLASVSLGYSIGALMLLEAGNPDLRFASRPLPGVPTTSTDPSWYVIDGQFRLAALYQVLTRDEPLEVLGDGDRPMRRQYYLDIEATLDPRVDRDDAIRSIDAADPCGEGLFALRWVFDETTVRRHPRLDVNVLDIVRKFVMPTIVLPKETTRWSIRVHGGADGPALSDRFLVNP